MRAIYILCIRQLKRYVRSPARIVGSLGQPVIFLLAFGFGLGAIFKQAGAGNYFNFLAPGIIAMGIIMTAVFSGIEIIWDRQFGFLKETLVAPVSRLEIVFGRVLGGSIVAMLQGFAVFIVCVVFGFRVHDWLLVPVALVFMFLISLLFTSIGTAIGSVLQDMQGFPLVMNFLVMPLVFISNAFFPMKDLPKVLEGALRLNPVTYGVDGLRGGLSHALPFTHAYTMSMFTDLGVLVVLSLILLAIGSYLFSKIQL